MQKRSEPVDKDGLSPCYHEEADSRVFVHVVHAGNSGHGKAMICTVDTDIVVLAVSNMHNMQNVRELWLTFGTRRFFRYIPCHSIANQFSKTTSNALTFFHAFTGCDSFCLLGSWQKDCIGDMESIFCCDSSISQALEKTLR